MPASGYIESLYHAADAYLALGYSVIPLHGDAIPARAKVAVVEWKPYQTRKPRADDLRDWFVQNRYGAIGIVTGRISGIAVLDLDSQRAYDLFCKTCPDLVERHVIKTRRGYHIYFRIPPHLHLPSRKVPEADWLADGRYVVARPTPGYKLVTGGEPKLLDQRDLNRITAFLDLLARTVTPIPTSVLEVPVVNPLPVSAHTLMSQYRYLASQIGRNEALFRVSLKARDHGWSVDDTITLLADLHTQQVATGDHAVETIAHRRKEAVATIYSAFSRPARPVRVCKGRGLSVSVVETLHSLGLKAVIRVINALRDAGVEPGELICYTTARRLLKGRGVGDWSLRKALAACLPDGKRIFTPSGLPFAPKVAAAEQHQPDYQKNAFLIGRQNQQKVPAHRPASYFLMPSDQELIERLRTQNTHPDPMTTADLATPRGTHLASLRELIARRPGQYPNQWLARRGGVSTRTIQRHKKLIQGLQVTPVYAEVRLHWSNLDVLPDDDSIKGAFLEDEQGKKYPPIPGIAAKLLAKGKGVVYKRQEANHYCMVGAPVAAVQVKVLDQPLTLVKRLSYPQPQTVSPPSRLCKPLLPSPIEHTAQTADHQPALPGFFPFRPAPPLPAWPRPQSIGLRVYRKALADDAQETLAQRMYDTINSQTTERAERISLASARRCVEVYGSASVEKTLNRLAQRRNLVKPAGFFITLLRSEARFRMQTS